jgi:Na+-transporting methylmalonyl-CoA/oxaloacetate decarboxylase beta subunit
MRLLTTKAERSIRMEYTPRPISPRVLVLFPIVVTLTVGLLIPDATPLISMRMLGNLLRVSGVVERLNKTAQNELANIATLFLGVTIGSTMSANLDTIAGLLFGKLMAKLTHGKINSLAGAAGISAFPMAGRLAAKVAQDEDFDNFILMHAMVGVRILQVSLVV